MTLKSYLSLILALFVISIISLQIDNSLSVLSQLKLAFKLNAVDFADFNFLYSQLPRLAMALLVGAILGLVGSLMQQLTQNNLTSPLTLGTSSGAFLALVVVSVFFPHLIGSYATLFAMVGALFAFGLIVVIAGIKNMTSLPFIVAGMVVNILLGAIAAAILLLSDQYAKNIFIWGAGDLAQNGWGAVIWLLPKLLVAFIVLFFAPRILMLLRLGQNLAKSRGLLVLPVFFILMLLGVFLVSASITKVGIISFIGLISPNLARVIGARTPKQELYTSMLLGALVLVFTDTLALFFSLLVNQAIPSGVSAAIIGAPALIWFSRAKLKTQSSLQSVLPTNNIKQARKCSKKGVFLLSFAFILVLVCSFFMQHNGESFVLDSISLFQLELRLPRVLSALFSGLGLAIAGLVLQRLVRNSLASPDILGVSSGATFALVFAGLFFGSSFIAGSFSIAFLGSMLVLLVLLAISKKQKYSPSNLILTGIALTALIQSLVQFALAKGTQDSYSILLWLSGSTYNVDFKEAIWLGFAVIIIFAFVGFISRWLNIITFGKDFATSRGLNYSFVSLCLLIIVALLCAFTTAVVGPIAFVGLIAPHMATMLGVKRVTRQIFVAGLAGASIMLWADFIGQFAFYPMQVSAGTLASILGGFYFLTLVVLSRFRRQ